MRFDRSTIMYHNQINNVKVMKPFVLRDGLMFAAQYEALSHLDIDGLMTMLSPVLSGALIAIVTHGCGKQFVIEY